MSDPVHAAAADQRTHAGTRVGRIVVWLAYWLLLAIATHYPNAERFAPSLPGFDKVAHVITFGLLAGLGVWAWVAAGPGRRRWLAWAGILLVYSAADELLQPLTGRQASVWDFLANAVGCVLGVSAAWWSVRRQESVWSPAKDGG